LDASRGGEREAPAIQLDLHSTGVRRGRTNISPCKRCPRYTRWPPRPGLLGIHANTDKALSHNTTLMVCRLRSHSTHVQGQRTIQNIHANTDPQVHTRCNPEHEIRSQGSGNSGASVDQPPRGDHTSPEEVLHVPALHDNLLSLSRLDKHGLAVNLALESCTISQGGHCFGQGHLKHGIYFIQYNREHAKVGSRQNTDHRRNTKSTESQAKKTVHWAPQLAHTDQEPHVTTLSESPSRETRPGAVQPNTGNNQTWAPNLGPHTTHKS